MNAATTSQATRGKGRPVAYRTSAGKRLPSVTTVISRFKESGGLVHWAYQCGLDGVDLNRARDDAGTAGKLAHELVDADVHGREPKVPSLVELGFDDSKEGDVEAYETIRARAYTALDAFREWKSSVAFSPIATELPLVDEEHHFGGTLDCVAMIGGKLGMLDYKTGNRIYTDHLVQVAAYRRLWNIARPESPIETMHLLRLGKEMADFHHHVWPVPVIDEAWKAFLCLRELYDRDAFLKRMVG